MAEKYELYPNEVVLSGVLTKIDNRTANSGNRFAVLSIETSEVYKEKITKMTFDVTAFNKSLEECIDSQLNEGDEVVIVAKLNSEEYKGKHYLKAMFRKVLSVKAHNTEAKSIQKQAKQESSKPSAQPVDQNTDVPF